MSALFAIAASSSSPFHLLGWICLGIFIASLALVVLEERLHLRKSKPVILAACAIWTLICIVQGGDPEAKAAISSRLHHMLAEYCDLLLFLMVAMVYVGAMKALGVFNILRAKLMSASLGYHGLYWALGACAFCISPFADNLTTAMVMGSVVMAVANGDRRFAVPGFIHVVVAANAGGVPSPFGDVTSLMVWQRGKLAIDEFLPLIPPAVIAWLVPALLMSFFLPKSSPLVDAEPAPVSKNGIVVVILFGITIIFSVIMKHRYGLPPSLGMMTGFGLFAIHSYFATRSAVRQSELEEAKRADIFTMVEKSEFDTLLFFFGVIFAIGGLSHLGWLAMLNTQVVENWGCASLCILAGLLSCIVDNIPMMYAVLEMNPDMSLWHWQLVTLTTGIGGSILAVGSAAGVALMGVAKGEYTFMAHLRYSWAVLIGFFAAVGVHWLMR